jgi:hypothetical protein
VFVEHGHVMGSAGPIPADKHRSFSSRIGRWPLMAMKVPLPGVSLSGPGRGVSLTPVWGPRRVRGGGTKLAVHAARQRGHPLTLTKEPRPVRIAPLILAVLR